MASATTRTGAHLYVQRMGARGPALVLVHGLGASGRSWRLVAERLRGQARVFCPDLLGFGRSQWPDAGYTAAEHLAALESTLAALGLDQEQVLLGGHSTGAVLAVAWAAAHPQRFCAVVPMSLPVYRSAAEARERIATLSPLARATVKTPPLGRLICEVMCAARPFWRALMPLLSPGVPADIARDYVLHDWASFHGTLQHVLVHHRLGPAARRLADSGLPVWLLHGDRDRVAPLDAVAELAQRYQWPLAVLPNAGHHLPITRARDCAALLRNAIRVSGSAVAG